MQRPILVRGLLMQYLLLGALATAHAAGESADPRTPIPRTDAEKTFVLAQMRLFLSSIAGIEKGLGSGDMEQVTREAEARGHMANVALARLPTLATKETADWKAMIGSTRAGFDRIAEQATAHEPQEKINSTIGTLMTQCVSCHQTYRIVVEGQ